MLITESLYNLLYNLPSAPPEMGGLLGQSKNTINTIFVDSGKISFRKSCQYVPNELLLNQTISDWDAQGIIFKGIFHTHKEGHGCQCLSSADIVYIRSIMNVKSLKKKEVEALCALSEYDSSVHTSTQITDFYWHMENIYTSIVILRSQYRRDCQAINELFISAERKAMLDELIRSIGESLQQKIKNNVVFLDSNGQLE